MPFIIGVHSCVAPEILKLPLEQVHTETCILDFGFNQEILYCVYSHSFSFFFGTSNRDIFFLNQVLLIDLDKCFVSTNAQGWDKEMTIQLDNSLLPEPNINLLQQPLQRAIRELRGMCKQKCMFQVRKDIIGNYLIWIHTWWGHINERNGLFCGRGHYQWMSSIFSLDLWHLQAIFKNQSEHTKNDFQ